MVWSDLFAGLAFYLIIEGLLPFANPQAWRRGLTLVSELDDGQLRRAGLVAMAVGLALLFLVRA